MIQDSTKLNFYKCIDNLCKDSELLIGKGNFGCDDNNQNNQVLTKKAIRIFSEALNLAGKDDEFELSPKYFANSWAGRCHKFKQLSLVLQNLYLRPFIREPQIKFFSQVIQKLDRKIKSLREKALSQGRLPVYSEGYLKDCKRAFQNQLNLTIVNPFSLESVDKESFHVLASRYRRIDGVKANTLEGRNFSRALMTTISLVNKTLKRGQCKQALLKALQQALKFATKMDTLKTKVNNHLNEEEVSFYFEKLSKIESVLAKIEKNKKSRYREGEITRELLSSSCVTESQEDHLKSFLSVANMRNSPIPNELSLHDIAWDAVQAIEALQNGEFIFIPLGTIDHAVLAQVECHVINGLRTYTYLLFNTGYGVNHHTREGGRENLYIRPLKIEGIRQEGFSYTFWNEMFSCNLETDINPLYRLQHKHLIRLGKGKKRDALDEPRYQAQKFGTCTYGAPEMAILPHLNPEEKAKLEVVKASHALKKQLKVVKHRKYLLAINQQVKKIPSLEAELQQSEALLRLSRIYLRESLSGWSGITLTKAPTFKQRKIKKNS